MSRLLVYVGTYTQGRQDGIYIFTLNPSSGTLTPVTSAAGAINPSFLALDPTGRFLYAVNEVGEFEGQPGGAVSAFAIDRASGALTLLNRQPTHGADPCHLSLDASRRWLFAANYNSGSVTLLPIRSDGRLGTATVVAQHHGASVDPERQAGPHAHSTILDPANRRVLVADLGLDQIMLYQFDAERGSLTRNEPPWVQVKSGAGPRHTAFHPNGRWLYSVNELDSTVTAWAFDAAKGMLRETRTLSTLPLDAGVNYAAHVQVSPSGKFLYVSNRGHDSLAIFSIETTSGEMSPIGHVSTQGQWPRHFALDPTGAWLIVANQRSDRLTTFRVNAETGDLTPVGGAQVPVPACVQIAPPHQAKKWLVDRGHTDLVHQPHWSG